MTDDGAQRRTLGIVVDAENLEGKLAGVLGVLSGIPPVAGDRLVFVGAERAQTVLDRYRLPAAWAAIAERIRNDTEPEAADRIITDLIRGWERDDRVVVLASRDSGFAYVLSQLQRRGTTVFVLGEERTAVHLRAHVPVLDVHDPSAVEIATAGLLAALRRD